MLFRNTRVIIPYLKSSINNNPPEFWFAAYVRSCQERKTADFLSRMGIEYYLPLQKETRKWSDRVKTVEKLVLPGLIFIRTTRTRRVEILSETTLICRYMTQGGSYNPVIIPDNQIEDFIFVLENGQDKVTVSKEIFSAGDAVEIISGSLKGLKAQFVDISGQQYAAVRIDNLCSAIIKISLNEIRKI